MYFWNNSVDILRSNAFLLSNIPFKNFVSVLPQTIIPEAAFNKIGALGNLANFQESTCVGVFLINLEDRSP